MKYTLKNNEKDARERLKAFWAGDSMGRPALHVVCDNPEYVKKLWNPVGMTQKEMDLSPRWYRYQASQQLSSTLFLAEAMPSTIINHGSHLAILALLAGSDYEYHNSAWIAPLKDIYNHPLPNFDANHALIGSLIDCINGVAKEVGDKAFINPPSLLDGLTTLSLLRTQQDLCIDLFDNREDVKKWSNALTTLYIECHRYFYEHVKSLGYGDMSAWLHVMADGAFEAVQCDFGVMLSPEMFEQFAMPGLRRLTEYLDYSLYHLDGVGQMRFLDQLETLPKLNGIQWNPEIFTEAQTKWIEAFREIRRRGFALYTHCNSVEEAVVITKELGPDGLMLVLPRFKSKDEADDAIKKIEAVC